jgi:hypothetical protein
LQRRCVSCALRRLVDPPGGKCAPATEIDVTLGAAKQ